VLLEEVGASQAGTEYRAAKLGPAGLERVVSLERIRSNLCQNDAAVQDLMGQVRFAAQMHHLNILKTYTIGKVGSACFISSEFVEGQTLRTIFARSRQEGLPLAIDQALSIAGKACAALESAHSRRTEKGEQYYHGFLRPSNVLVSYEGEVRVRGFGYWASRAREMCGPAEEDFFYLAPEQVLGQKGDPRSDVFALGAILFEALTGTALFAEGRRDDVTGRLTSARLQVSNGEEALPGPIGEILGRSLAQEPSERYSEIGEMWKALDGFLYSAGLSATTFDLAFYMHSLFREDIDREAKALQEEKEAVQREFLLSQTKDVVEPVAAPTSTPASPHPTTAPPPPADVAVPAPLITAESAKPSPSTPPPGRIPQHVTLAPTNASSPNERRKSLPRPWPKILGSAAALVLLAFGGYVVMAQKHRTTAPSPSPPEAPEIAAQAQALEEKVRLAEVEAARARAEAEGTPVSTPAQVPGPQKAKDPGPPEVKASPPRKDKDKENDRDPRTRKEQKNVEKDRTENRSLAKDPKEAPLASSVDEKPPIEKEPVNPITAPSPATAVASNTPPATLPVAPTNVPSPAAPSRVLVRPGTLVNLGDAGVVPPALIAGTGPSRAGNQKVAGTVELEVLVDEKGNVADAKVIAESPPRTALNDGAQKGLSTAIEGARRAKYKPATKDGIPVKVWMRISLKYAAADTFRPPTWAGH